MEVKEARKP